MTTKTLSEILTCIRNAVKVKRIGVKIKKSRITKELAEIMLQEGLIEGIQDPFIPHTTKKTNTIFVSSTKIFRNPTHPCNHKLATN